MKLSNKTALITGASNGSGRSIALGFAERGADLFLTAREDRDGLNRTLEEARAMSVSFIDDRSKNHG